MGRDVSERVLTAGLDYDDQRAAFAWPTPSRYNMAVDACERWAKAHPERTAIIDKREDGRIDRVSYARLDGMASRFANVLAGFGIGRGDRVALILPQLPQTAAAHIAIYKLGAIAVPLAMLFGEEAMCYRLENSGARAVIMTTASAGKLARIRDRLSGLEEVFIVDGGGPDGHDLMALAQAARDVCPAVETAGDDPALMIYTSGTTGPPKGALHAHRVLIGHLPGIEFAHEYLPQPGDILWTPSDWAWAGGLLNVLLPGLRYGVPVVARKFAKFDPAAAWELMAELAIANVFMAPTALKMMRAEPPDKWRDRLRLRTLFSGGEAVGRELQGWARETLGMAINEVYGQTECNLVLESCAVAGVLKPGSIGKPVPGHEVAIIDSEGNELGVGEIGNIAVKRPDPVMFLAYWDNPAASRDKFIGDWLITGDQGVRDEEGYFSFVGRDDDVITSAGYRIGPGEIEDCLLSHPAVKIAAAVGKPDELRTEIVKAFIVLNDGYAASDALAAQISDHVRRRLSAHEYPREIAFIDDIPLTTTGKVIRRLLRQRA